LLEKAGKNWKELEKAENLFTFSFNFIPACFSPIGWSIPGWKAAIGPFSFFLSFFLCFVLSFYSLFLSLFLSFFF